MNASRNSEAEEQVTACEGMKMMKNRNLIAFIKIIKCSWWFRKGVYVEKL